MKLLVSILAAAVMAGSVLPARAADDTKVKAATEQVQSGARKIGGVVGVGGGTLYGLNENKKNDEKYREAYSSCMRSRGYTG